MNRGCEANRLRSRLFIAALTRAGWKAYEQVAGHGAKFNCCTGLMMFGLNCCLGSECNEPNETSIIIPVRIDASHYLLAFKFGLQHHFALCAIFLIRQQCEVPSALPYWLHWVFEI
jgi:hypothetical protein